MRLLCRINHQIISKSNNLFLNYNNFYTHEITFILEHKKNYIIYTKLTSFHDILTLFALIKNNQFVIYFDNKKNFYVIEKKIANFIEELQKQSFTYKNNIQLKIIICSKIPDDNFFKNNYNKNKEFFVLLPQKNKTAILYSKSNIYNNTI